MSSACAAESVSARVSSELLFAGVKRVREIIAANAKLAALKGNIVAGISWKKGKDAAQTSNIHKLLAWLEAESPRKKRAAAPKKTKRQSSRKNSTVDRNSQEETPPKCPRYCRLIPRHCEQPAGNFLTICTPKPSQENATKEPARK